MTLSLPSRSQAALKTALQKYSGSLGQDWVNQALDRLLAGIQSIANPADDLRGVETGDSPATVRADLIADLIGRFDNGDAIAEELNLPFKISTATDVAGGGGRFVQQQSDVDEYPALALSRFYDRMVPRGLLRGPGGALIPVPDQNWPTRWAAAGAACGDDGWLPWQGDAQGGRGVALKSSGIWQALGDGAGGYDDTLGNPFPPFAFNSGFDVDGVPYKECVQLGLIGNGEQPKPSATPLSTLFSLVE